MQTKKITVADKYINLDSIRMLESAYARYGIKLEVTIVITK